MLTSGIGNSSVDASKYLSSVSSSKSTTNTILKTRHAQQVIDPLAI